MYSVHTLVGRLASAMPDQASRLESAVNAVPSKVINFRAPAAKQALIDHAAEVSGMNRTEFILDAACEKAHDVLADQTRFALDGPAMKRFNALLDAPVADNAAIRRLLERPAPWEG